MKKLFCTLFSFLFLFSASCSAGNQGEPKICERLAFYERDGMLSALLSFAADESGKSETETFSRKNARELLDALLSTKDTILYKSVRTVIFEDSLSEARKKELLCALFSRAEFQLKAEAYEKEDVFSPFTPLAAKKVGTLPAYYREKMNKPFGKGGGLSLDT